MGGSRAGGLSRRRWLALAAAGAWGGRLRAGEPQGTEDREEGRADQEVQGRAKAVGLGPFEVDRTEHYLGLGDAPAAFRRQALTICEGIARDYLEHFRARGFEVDRPPHRLTVVTLADHRGFVAFLGEDPGPDVAGIYDLETNRLVMFDNRPGGASATGAEKVRAEEANRLSLAHEATHQLTFNTGLLDRGGDVPLSISEGLAMYGELRRPRGRTAPGQVNRYRLQGLIQAQNARVSWIPVSALIVADAPLTDPETVQLAYAEGWLLVHFLMQDRVHLPHFRAYLEALRGRRTADHRLDDARARLGDLDRLDQDVRRHARRVLR